MDLISKIRDVHDRMLLSSIINNEGMYQHANDDLTKIVRQICGLD